jgi:hypothetical protein
MNRWSGEGDEGEPLLKAVLEVKFILPFCRSWIPFHCSIKEHLDAIPIEGDLFIATSS